LPALIVLLTQGGLRRGWRRDSLTVFKSRSLHQRWMLVCSQWSGRSRWTVCRRWVPDEV